MNTHVNKLTPADQLAGEFRAALDDMATPLFAVLDGGQFDDLEDELERKGIAGRPLFLREGDPNLWRNGPWMISLESTENRAYAEKQAIEKPCVVFWACPQGEQVLWKHLRSINEILIPDVRFQQGDSHSRFERVLFRHWDPIVLGSILSELDVTQFARFFGPASAILMYLEADGDVLQAMRPEEIPNTPNGPLTIRLDQLESIEDQRKAKYCKKMSAILREMAPDETAAMGNAELNERVLRYEASGNRMGLTQERSLSIWNYLMLTSGDRFESQPEIRGYLQSQPGTPDENVETLLAQMIRLTGTMKEVH